MDKDLKKVRQSIVQRKKMRGLIPKEGQNRHIVSAFPQEEEKHGYLPIISDNTVQSNHKSKLVPGIMLKGILSVFLFFGVALLGQTDATWLKKPKEWSSGVLTKEFPFAKVNLWYQDSFGTPLAFTAQSDQVVTNTDSHLALPVNGNVTETFQTNGQGIKIAPEEAANVSVVGDGVIIFAGNDRKMGKTVIVQHADGTTSTYGYLSEVDVHIYQFVQNNEQIGKFAPTVENESVYFAIERDNAYIDPVQVIKVDDTP